MFTQAEDPLRSPILLPMAALYLLGGAVGLFELVPRLNGPSMSLPEALVNLFHLALLLAAMVGSVQLLLRRGNAVRVLFWLSWLCVPTIETPWLMYGCGFALDVVPEVSLYVGTLTPSMHVHFGHRFALLQVPGWPSLGAGVNLAEHGCALILGRLEAVPPARHLA